MEKIIFIQKNEAKTIKKIGQNSAESQEILRNQKKMPKLINKISSQEEILMLHNKVKH